jgi:hypothetical protein
MAFPTNANQVQAFAGAMYGIQIGTGTLAQVNSDIIAAGGLNKALNGYYTASFGGVSTATVAATVAANLGLTGDALNEGKAYIAAQLNAAAANARGEVIANILNLFSGLTADAKFGAAATAWNTKVDAAAAYTGVADAAIGTVVTTNNIFTLTTNVESFTGAAGTDSFNAAIVGAGAGTAGTGTGTTLNPGDVLAGGAGVDTLNITVSGAFNTTADTAISGLNLTGIERVMVSNFDSSANTSAQSISLAGITGVTDVGISSSTANGATAFADLGNKVNASMANGAADLTIAYALSSITSGTADSQNLTVSGVSAGTFSAGNGIESFNVTSNTASNVLKAITVGTPTNSTPQTLTVTGDKNLTITDALTNTVTKVDASAFTGNLNVEVASGANHSVTGGVGNDVIRMNTGLTAADSVNGGDGTDVLAITASLSSKLTNVSNIEVLRAGGTTGDSLTIDASNITGVNSFEVMASASVGTMAFTNVLSNSTITAKTDLVSASNTVSMLTASSTLNLVLDNSTSDSAGNFTRTTGLDVASLSFTNVSTLNVTSSGAGLTSSTTGGDYSDMTFIASTGLTKMTLAGDTNFNFNTNIATVTSFDATNFTGHLKGTLGTAGALIAGSGSDNITGSSGNDTLTLGAGNDTVNGNGGNDNISGGDGNDAITVGAPTSTGTTTVDGGAGNDTVIISSTTGKYSFALGSGDDVLRSTALTAASTAIFESTDTITGGDGTDRLRFDAASGATSSSVAFNGTTNGAYLANISGFEGVTLDIGGVGHATAGTLTFTFDDILSSVMGGTVDISVIDSLTATAGSAASVAAVVNIDGSNVLLASTKVKVASSANVIHNYTLGNATENVTLSTDADTVRVTNVANWAAADTLAGGSGSDVLTFAYAVTSSTTAAADSTTFTNVTGFETVNLDGVTGIATGTLSFTIGDAFATNNAAVSNTTLTVVRAQAVAGTTGSTVDDTGTTTINGSAVTTVKLNLSGADGADAITGGAAADVIVGNAGTDTLIGGAGNDTISGGADGDNITGGEGADSITAGAGSDTIVLTEVTAARDIVRIAGTLATTADYGDVVTGFAAGSATTADLLQLGYNNTGSVGDAGTAYTAGVISSITSTSAGTSGFTASKVVIIKGAVAGSADATTVASFIDGYDTFASTGFSVGYVVVSVSDGNARVYAYANGDNATVASSEITLVATLVGVTTDSLAAGNFS